jgi:membrane protease YdiL (CAAX protease family)
VQNEDFQNQNYNQPLIDELTAAQTAFNHAPSPNNPPWNSWMAFGIWTLSIFAIIFFPLLFVVPYIFTSGNASAEFLKTDPTSIFLQIISVIPAHIATLLAAWFVVTKMNKFSYKQTLGWNWGGSRWWHFLLILVGFFVVGGVVNNFLPENDNDFMRILQSSRSTVYAVAILATFTAPVVEEVVYRGLLYSAIQRSIGVKGAVAIVTTMFAGVHFLQYWGSPGTILMICVLSLVLTMIRVRTDNLLPCIAMHMIFNGIQSIVLVLEPYLPKEMTSTQEGTSFIYHLFK